MGSATGVTARGKACRWYRRVQIEINAAERTGVIALAQNDRDKLVERDAVAQIRAAAFKGADGLGHQRDEGRFELLGTLVDGNYVQLHKPSKLPPFPVETSAKFTQKP